MLYINNTIAYINKFHRPMGPWGKYWLGGVVVVIVEGIGQQGTSEGVLGGAGVVTVCVMVSP